MAQYIPNDPLFQYQWYLLNTGQTGFGSGTLDLNVTYVWPDYTGKGVSIAVYDNGVQYTHPDLASVYDASLSAIINGLPSDAHALTLAEVGGSTGFNGLNAHGTLMAGIAAMADNEEGGVGVAFGASLVGVYYPVLGTGNSAPPSTQLLGAAQNLKNYDVTAMASGGGGSATNANWTSFYAALTDAVTTGRSGLGTVMLNSVHNNGPGFGGVDNNASQLDSHRFMIHVGGVMDTGDVVPNAQRTASMLVSGFTGFQASKEPNGSPRNVLATDIMGADGMHDGDYSQGGGTTSAVSQIAGVAALMLEANPNLGWRDVQTIFSLSARHTGSAIGGPVSGTETEAWGFNAADNWNGGGRHYTRDYGFGIVDALAAVRLSETWLLGAQASTSANEVNRTAVTNHGTVAIPNNTGGNAQIQFNIAQDVRVENAQLRISLSHPREQDLKVTLISPNGTTSVIYAPVSAEAGTGNASTGFRINSQEFRGESGIGTWTAIFEDNTAGNAGNLTGSSSLVLSGSSGLTNDRYVYTNEFSDYASLGSRSTLTDSDGGSDAINAAAVSGDSTINLNAGTVSTIDGTPLTIAPGSVIEAAIGGDGNDTLIGNSVANILYGGRGNDTLTGNAGDDSIDGAQGDDTAVFSSNFNAYTVQDFGSKIVVSGPDGTDTLTRVEHMQFADGTVTPVDDGNPLFDALYYASRNADVYASGVNLLDHYNTSGWHEGRDPNALFDVSGYLANNPDVAAAGMNPLDHYDAFGWREGRDPSANFDTTLYLLRNPDVAAAGIDPLWHYLKFGQAEGRVAYEAVGKDFPGLFDAAYYLWHNPDVAAAGIDPLTHYNTSGWQEGRNPNAWFDSAGYVSHYADVAAAGVNPLHHYQNFGWQEGRDPSAGFDTLGYLAANPDVAAAGVNPLDHYLHYGIFEGRALVNDGSWHV